MAFRQRGGYDQDQPSARPWLYGIATRLISRRRREEVRFFRAIARTGIDPVADPVAEPVADEGVRRADARRLHRRRAGALAGLSTAPMATTRTYGDGCAIARALDLIGERWALLVVRELLLGPKRYTDLRRGLPNASPNVLSERLRELEDARVIRRHKLPPPASSRVYELTEWGHELDEIVMSLGRWAARSPTPPGDAPVASADSVILALRARFEAGAANGLCASYELRLGEDRFRIDVADGEIKAARGNAHRPDVTIETDPDTLSAVLWGTRTLADAQRSRTMSVEGDKALVERFVRLFPLPGPAATVSPA